MGAAESFTDLKSFADIVRAKGSVGLIGEECASGGITVTTDDRHKRKIHTRRGWHRRRGLSEP